MSKIALTAQPTPDERRALQEYQDEMITAAAAFRQCLQAASELLSQENQFSARRDELKASGKFDSKTVQEIATLEGQISMVQQLRTKATIEFDQAQTAWMRLVNSAATYIATHFHSSALENLKALFVESVAAFYSADRAEHAPRQSGLAEDSDAGRSLLTFFRMSVGDDYGAIERGSARIASAIAAILKDEPFWTFPADSQVNTPA